MLILLNGAGAAGGSGTIAITTPIQYQTFQRSAGVGSIPVTGTYTGSPTAIEASFAGGAYQTIVASPSGGTYSGTLTGQTQGQGTLVVRFTNDTAVSANKTLIGIGDIFYALGDSNAQGQGTNLQSASGSLTATAFKEGGTWQVGNDRITGHSGTGSFWPLLSTLIMADQGVPVAFVTTTLSGTDCAGDRNSWAAAGGAQYDIMVTTSAAVVSALGVLAVMGTNAIAFGDTGNTTISQADYLTGLNSMANGFFATLPGAPKTLVSICGEVSGLGTPPDLRLAEDRVRAADRQFWSTGTHGAPGPCLIDQDYTDNLHYASDVLLQQVADRWWVAISNAFYGGTNGRGPVLTSGIIDGGLTTITATFDRDLAAGTTYGGFRVLDNGTPATITSATRTGPRTVSIIVSAPVAAAATTKLSFGSGNDAVGQTVPKSVAITLPDARTINLPAEPIIALQVTAAPTVTAGKISYALWQSVNQVTN